MDDLEEVLPLKRLKGRFCPTRVLAVYAQCRLFEFKRDTVQTRLQHKSPTLQHAPTRWSVHQCSSVLIMQSCAIAIMMVGLPSSAITAMASYAIRGHDAPSITAAMGVHVQLRGAFNDAY